MGVEVEGDRGSTSTTKGKVDGRGVEEGRQGRGHVDVEAKDEAKVVKEVEAKDVAKVVKEVEAKVNHYIVVCF